jgi:hypothetical protein
MYNTFGRGVNPFDPPTCRIETGSEEKFVAWVAARQSEGWLLPVEHSEHINMLRAMSKKRQAELSKPYDPSPQDVANARANKASGYAQKPYPKPTREPDKKVVGPWTPIRKKW